MTSPSDENVLLRDEGGEREGEAQAAAGGGKHVSTMRCSGRDAAAAAARRRRVGARARAAHLTNSSTVRRMHVQWIGRDPPLVTSGKVTHSGIPQRQSRVVLLKVSSNVVNEYLTRFPFNLNHPGAALMLNALRSDGPVEFGAFEKSCVA
jgi:hypothetical protein